MNAEGLPPNEVNGVTPPPPTADSGDGGGCADVDDFSREAMMHIVAIQMMRHHPIIVRTAQLMSGEPLADIYTPEELERIDNGRVTFLLVVALLIGLYVANG